MPDFLSEVCIGVIFAACPVGYRVGHAPRPVSCRLWSGCMHATRGGRDVSGRLRRVGLQALRRAGRSAGNWLGLDSCFAKPERIDLARCCGLGIAGHFGTHVGGALEAASLVRKARGSQTSLRVTGDGRGVGVRRRLLALCASCPGTETPQGALLLVGGIADVPNLLLGAANFWPAG